MINSARILILCISMLFSSLANSQYSDNTFMVSFAPGTSQQEIDQARSDLHSIELDITPITNMRLWKVTSFPFTYPPTGQLIIDINETDKKSRARSSTNGGGLNYFISDVIGAPVSPLLKDEQLDCQGQLSTYLPAKSSPVSIGVFDTGLNYFMDPNIPDYFFDLAGYNQWDHLNNDPIADDLNGHGSHMASIISHTINKSYGLGQSNIAPLESYDVRKTFDIVGSGFMFEIIDGLEEAALNGINIASCSWSFKTTLENALESPLYTTLSLLESDYNMLIVAAAGNDGTNLDNPNANERFFPAGYDLPNILTATTYNCQGQLAPFANYGIRDIDIALPGIGLAGLESDNIKYRSGTSQSTALLAGIAASLGTYLQDFHYAPIICAIMNSAQIQSDLHDKVKSGGVIDAAAALSILGNCINNIQGKETNSQTPLTGITKIEIFPNPAMDYVTINYEAENVESLTISISDLQGRILIAKDVDVTIGDNNIYFQLEELETGFYNITIRNSSEIESFKIIIEK